MALPCQRLLLGVSGSILSTQLSSYLIAFRREFASEIRIIMTATAAEMVDPRVLELYTDAPVFCNIWGTPAIPAPHIRLTRWADMFLVLPATANLIGKAANGVADDLLSTAVVAADRPVVFAPSMNPMMFGSPAVERNLERLELDGHYIVWPSEHISVTTGNFDIGLTVSVDEILPHMWHVLMRRLREGYWDAATREKPLTPAERVRQLRIVGK